MPDLSALVNMTDLRSLAVPAAVAYLVVLLFVAFDALLPVVPGEAVVVAGGVLAAAGELQLAALLLAAVLGALAGDCTAYALGRRAGRAGLGWALRARRRRRAVRWAAGALDRRGGPIVLAARFIPGGRTSAAVAAGFVRFPADRYARWSALAGVLWSVYAAGLGYLGGQAFADRPWAALLAPLAVATAVGLLALAAVGRRDGKRPNSAALAGVRSSSPGRRPAGLEPALSRSGDGAPERCG